MTYDFSGKVVLITGGTGALGRACLEDEVVGSNPTRSTFINLVDYGIVSSSI
jgi:FlaA1/EpsC-like NDP-sugar epimerase